VTSLLRHSRLELHQFERIANANIDLYGNLPTDYVPPMAESSILGTEEPAALRVCVQDIPHRVLQLARSEAAVIVDLVVPDTRRQSSHGSIPWYERRGV
jgi:hypothetical protein